MEKLSIKIAGVVFMTFLPLFLYAGWTIALPDIYATWREPFVIPVYVSYPEMSNYGTFTINLCDDSDSFKFVIDNVSFSGNGVYTTVCDTCSYCVLPTSNIIRDPFPTSYTTITWLLVSGFLPPLNNEILLLINAHSPYQNPNPPEFDTIELYLSASPGCPPPTDTSYTFINGNIYIVPFLYTRGDVNVSGGPPDLSDVIYLLEHLLNPSTLPCQRAADCNLDGEINVADAVALVNYLFMGGSLPEPAYPNTCGYNFEDTLPCDEFPPCGYGGD